MSLTYETKLVLGWIILSVVLFVAMLFGFPEVIGGAVVFGSLIGGIVMLAVKDWQEMPGVSPVPELKDNWNSVKTRVSNRFSGRKSSENENPVGISTENPVSNTGDFPVMNVPATNNRSEYPAGNPNLYTHEVETSNAVISSEGTVVSDAILVEGPYTAEDVRN